MGTRDSRTFREKVRHPEPITHVTVNYVVLALALVFEAGAWVVAFREFRRTRCPSSTARRRSASP